MSNFPYSGVTIAVDPSRVGEPASGEYNNMQGDNGAARSVQYDSYGHPYKPNSTDNLLGEILEQLQAIKFGIELLVNGLTDTNVDLLEDM